MNVHVAPRTEEERLEILRLIRDQTTEVFEDQTMVTCAGCGRKARLYLVFRCYFCGLVFCHACAKEHFGTPAGPRTGGREGSRG